MMMVPHNYINRINCLQYNSIKAFHFYSSKMLSSMQNKGKVDDVNAQRFEVLDWYNFVKENCTNASRLAIINLVNV